MKILITILLIFPLLVNAQQTAQSRVLPGEIMIPALQSLKVELVKFEPVSFNSPEEIGQPKYLTGLYKVTVISNIPWIVEVSSTSPNLASRQNDNNKKIPLNFVELKGNTPRGFQPLSTTPQVILRHQNDQITNVYYIDVKMSADVKFGSGDFRTQLLFSISPE